MGPTFSTETQISLKAMTLTHAQTERIRRLFFSPLNQRSVIYFVPHSRRSGCMYAV